MSLEPTLVHLAVGRLCQVRKITPADAAHAEAVLLPPLDGCHGVRIERARPLRERQAREQPPQRAQRAHTPMSMGWNPASRDTRRGVLDRDVHQLVLPLL